MTRCSRGVNPGAPGKSSASQNIHFSVRASHKSSLPGRCRNPDQVIVAKGDAFSDIKCDDATASADYGRM